MRNVFRIVSLKKNKEIERNVGKSKNKDIRVWIGGWSWEDSYRVCMG